MAASVQPPAPSYPVELAAPDIAAYAGNTGIPYVTSFDSGRPGPHVLVNALTHGNEICGAIALDQFFRAGPHPVRGKLTLSWVIATPGRRRARKTPDASANTGDLALAARRQMTC